MPKDSKKAQCWGRAQSWWRSEVFTGLRSQCRVPVTQGSGLKKMPRHPVLLIVLLALFKVSSKMTNFFYDLFKVSKFYLVLMHMYIFLWCFLWLKIVITFQKWLYGGMVDIFLLSILGGCPNSLHYTILTTNCQTIMCILREILYLKRYYGWFSKIAFNKHSFIENS